MNRIVGVVILLVVLYAALFASDPNASSTGNLIDVANRQGFYAVLTFGVGLLIVTGGIDLSLGSVVGLTAVLFGVLMQRGNHPYLATALALGSGVAIGLINGLLVTTLRLQPFLVTLCGLFVYRGVARQLTSSPVGLQKVINQHPDFVGPIGTLRNVFVGKDADGALSFPLLVVVAVVLAAVIGLFLHKSVYGRYWYAIGYNESAAKFAGINVNGQRLIVYILCSTLAAFGGVLLLLDYGTAAPESAGESLELYAITGAVLGGCSLRGGEGTAIGILLGAAVLPLLRNLVLFLGIRDAIVPSVIGLTLLSGVLADEFFRRGYGPWSYLRLLLQSKDERKTPVA
ncbi:ABC transporter permease [Fimbriiglobus ruber]|uniref:Ribose ABC transport system, permease protein RbsC n=1 Tax=Fimbriiglobus ruber TaxID=1908690 RepID=A0A225CZ00_9BACT|nr:ABC transporter permease [Fimbriiglobus ruber]OWK34571.1 Ribose ABC transport system, permease protein RbsC [Fimbriiglobus ruber]